MIFNSAKEKAKCLSVAAINRRNMELCQRVHKLDLREFVYESIVAAFDDIERLHGRGFWMDDHGNQKPL